MQTKSALALIVVASGACQVEPDYPLRVTVLAGIVGDATRRPVGGVLVQLVALDDQGQATPTRYETLTDEDGRFSLPLEGPFGPGLVVAASLPAGSLRAPALGDGRPVVVQPVTEALVRVILGITGGGQSWAALSASELRALHDRVLAELSVELTLDDLAALEDWVRAVAGDRLASAFAGHIMARPTRAVLTANTLTAGPDFTSLPPPPVGSACSRRAVLVEGARFVFDLLADGTLCDVGDGNQNDAFDIAFGLRLRGQPFAGGDEEFPAQASSAWEDGRELVLGPVATQSGLAVTRKIWVTPDDDVVRFLEILHNPGASELTVTVEISGDLGSDEETLLLLSESAGARVVAGDHYAASLAASQPDPTVGFVWDGFGADQADRLYFPPDSFGGFQYAWQDVRLGAGRTVVFAHFVQLSAAREASAVQGQLAALLVAPPLWGLSAGELSALANFHTTSLGNLTGAAGAIAPGLLFTATNIDSGESSVGVSALDGSFSTLLLGADAGERVQLRSLTGGVRLVEIGP